MEGFDLPRGLEIARIAAKNSDLEVKVGSAWKRGKSQYSGYNKGKTHPKYANPEKHIRKTLHAELDCLAKVPYTDNGIIYVYREVHGFPAMARPCNHCMEFIREAGVEKIVYSVPHEPYWEEEEL